MVTAEDIKKMINAFRPIFATKEDLEIIKYDMQRFITKDYLEEKLFEFRSDIFNKVDTVYGELKTEREEQAIHAHRHDEIEENIEKLNKEVFPPTYSHRVTR